MKREKKLITAYIFVSIVCPIIMVIYYFLKIVPKADPIISQSILGIFYILFILLAKNEKQKGNFFWTIMSVIFPSINVTLNPSIVIIKTGSILDVINFKLVPFITLTLFPLVTIIIGYLFLTIRIKSVLKNESNDA